MSKEELNNGGELPKGWAYYIEKRTARYGRWGKKLAFIAYMNDFLGDLSPVKSVALFGAATYVSVWKILNDYHHPRGSTRNYVSELAGDDNAVRLIRGYEGDAIPWDYAWKKFVGDQTMLQKALKCGWRAMYRNIENGSLIVYWAYSIGWKIYGYLLRRSDSKSILKAMFPRGLGQFIIGQLRTMGLLYGFGFVFWVTMGIAGTLKLNKDGLTKEMTAFLIMLTSVIAVNIETKYRYKPLAAFMLMTIID
jgi:hypothetical protein